jgi:hypothetical protein
MDGQGMKDDCKRGKEKKCLHNLSQKMKGEDYMGDLCVDGRIMLKCI